MNIWTSIPGGQLRLLTAVVLMATTTVRAENPPEPGSAATQTANRGIYRCGEGSGATFSQIPCSETAEQVRLEDRMMYSPAGTRPGGKDAVPGNTSAETGLSEPASPAQAMNEFVARLEQQRTSQLKELDSKIMNLKNQVAELESTAGESAERSALLLELESLEVSRQSIDSQYESMITEASRRAVQLAHTDAGDA